MRQATEDARPCAGRLESGGEHVRKEGRRRLHPNHEFEFGDKWCDLLASRLLPHERLRGVVRVDAAGCLKSWAAAENRATRALE